MNFWFTGYACRVMAFAVKNSLRVPYGSVKVHRFTWHPCPPFVRFAVDVSLKKKKKNREKREKLQVPF